MNIRLLRFKYSDSITNPMEKLIDYLGDIWKPEPIQNVDYNWSNEENKLYTLRCSKYIKGNKSLQSIIKINPKLESIVI